MVCCIFSLWSITYSLIGLDLGLNYQDNFWEDNGPQSLDATLDESSLRF